MRDKHFYAAQVWDKKANQVRSEPTILTPDGKSFGHELTETCWCHPTVEDTPDGRLIIHHRNPDVHGHVDLVE